MNYKERSTMDAVATKQDTRGKRYSNDDFKIIAATEYESRVSAADETEYKLSLVGFDHADLLYAAIKANHAKNTGRQLKQSPSFGGNSDINIEWSQTLQADEGVKPGQHHVVTSKIGYLIRTMGKRVFEKEPAQLHRDIVALEGPAAEKRRLSTRTLPSC